VGERNFVVVRLQAGKGEATNPFSTQLHSKKFEMGEDRAGNVRKAIPLQTWAGPEGSRSLRLPDFKTVGT
jgi:hypothetical protein